MLYWLNQAALVIAVAGTCAGIGYYLLCLHGVRCFYRDAREPLPDFAPPVSILKPLRGADREIYDSFRSHCLQDYPDYELVFGVSNASDDAAPVVERLIREFPERRIRLVVCPQALGTNGKVSSLVQMLAAAEHRILLVNDSDICVPRDYLRKVIAHLESPDVGLVTCLYRGLAAPTMGSRLESVGISTEFHPGVLAARALEGEIRFALGSTLAFTRESLKAIGGFEPLVDYLADDYELGKRMAETGFRVILSDTVVDTHLPAYSFRRFFEHQLRWARSTRHSRRWGYFGLVLTFGLPWSLAALALARGALWAWALAAATLALRYAVATAVASGVLRDRQFRRDFWLVPFRDLIAVVVWVGNYLGRRVAWRGEQFVLRDGKIEPLRT